MAVQEPVFLLLERVCFFRDDSNYRVCSIWPEGLA